MKTKNPPIFPLPNEPGFEQESDPLEGPAGSFVSGVPGTFAGKSGHAFDGTDAFAVRPSHPGPISDADFPTQATFTASTGKAFDRQEVR